MSIVKRHLAKRKARLALTEEICIDPGRLHTTYTAKMPSSLPTIRPTRTRILLSACLHFVDIALPSDRFMLDSNTAIFALIFDQRLLSQGWV